VDAATFPSSNPTDAITGLSRFLSPPLSNVLKLAVGARAGVPEKPEACDRSRNLALSHSLSRDQGIDYVLKHYGLDAIIAPTSSPAWTTDLLNGDHVLGVGTVYSSPAGYPIVNVPAGDAFGVPIGLSFIGTAWSEPTLIKLAYAFEQLRKARIVPTFADNLPPEKGSSSSVKPAPQP
jgi:Asp-tRNA(Asn)/Glu-tRNA(Gln) amidotransferase A subunit family amidase